MGNNNVVAGPKDGDKTGIEDQKSPCLEEVNSIDSKKNNQIVSEHEFKDFHEEIKGPSSENSCVGDDLCAKKQMLDLTEDIEAQSELSEKNGESPLVQTEETQELLETKEVKDPVEEVKLLYNNDLRAMENLSENKEKNDTDLLCGSIDEKEENGENLIHDTDSEVMKTIWENEENNDTNLLRDSIDEKEENGENLVHDIDSDVMKTILKNEEDNDTYLFRDSIADKEENGENLVLDIDPEVMKIILENEEDNDTYLLRNSLADTEENGENLVHDIDSEVMKIISENEENNDTYLLHDSIDEKEENGENLVHDIDSEVMKTISENEENNDTYLLCDGIDEKEENGENLVEIDSKVMKTISKNEEKMDIALPIDGIGAKTEDMSCGDGPEYIDMEENESQIEDTTKGEVIEEIKGLEQVIAVNQEIEILATELTANIEEKGKLETELQIPDPQEADFGNSFNSVSLKLIDSYFVSEELQTLEPHIDVSNVVQTKSATFLENETLIGRLSTGSIQNKPTLNLELKKSPSFVFDLSLESKFDDSDQTPLLFNNKAVYRSLSSPSSQPISMEEKTIQVERSDSSKLNGPFSNSIKEEELGTNFLKQDCETSSQEKALVKGSEKRKPWPSLFTTCICCATAIS